MTHSHDGIAAQLARDIDCNRQIEGSMLLRRELERHPQQTLAVIQEEMAREQRNGSTKKLEIHANGEIFITDYQPASGYASEGVYVGMYPGRQERQATQPQAQLEQPAPEPVAPPRQYVAETLPPPPPPDYPAPAPETFYAPRPRAELAPRPFYSDSQPGVANGVAQVAVSALEILGGVALGAAIGRHMGGRYYGYGNQWNAGSNFYSGEPQWQRENDWRRQMWLNRQRQLQYSQGYSQPYYAQTPDDYDY